MNLYKTAQWQRMRLDQLKANPLCQCPHHHGMDASALGEVVDHIKPHRGNRHLFFDRRNLQTLTKQCHDKYKQSEEKGGRGFDQGCNANGEPLNRDAQWYAV